MFVVISLGSKDAYVYTHIHTHMYIYTYIYMYVHRPNCSISSIPLIICVRDEIITMIPRRVQQHVLDQFALRAHGAAHDCVCNNSDVYPDQFSRVLD